MYVVGVPFRCRCIFPLVVAKSKDKGVVVAHKAPSGESESQSVSSYNQAAILDAIQPKVTDDMNSDLMAPYSDEEINELHDEVTTPELAEALALRRALSLAGDEGFGRIMVVSDCLSLIQRVNSSTMDRSSVGVVVQDIKALASHFEVSSFTHVYQSEDAAGVVVLSPSRHLPPFAAAPAGEPSCTVFPDRKSAETAMAAATTSTSSRTSSTRRREESDDEFFTDAAVLIHEHIVSQIPVFRVPCRGARPPWTAKENAATTSSDYFKPNPLFVPHLFRRRFRMRPLFRRIMDAVKIYDDYFYEYTRMSESTALESMYRNERARDAGHAQDRRPWQRRRAVELAVADLNLARRCLQPRHAQAAAPLLPSPPRSAPSRAPPRQFPPASTSAPASSAPAVPARVDLRPGELRPGSPRPPRPPPCGALPARVDVRPGELCPPASTSARPRRPPASGAARGEARDGGQRRRPEARPPALASWRGAVRHGTAARGGGSRRGQRRSRLGGAR
ncbi:hypothetical protein QYE76_055432 [Lolium multiflorum]|uniref:RNase H type-1 domain-containing protein n=1 Tax=Lolium multiflorum TaxID=4521 RepID=A0AAD8SZQ1_LOLMU|nr:hypothetical protein QYE76_055432 [Lolium multiflorum]